MSNGYTNIVEPARGFPQSMPRKCPEHGCGYIQSEHGAHVGGGVPGRITFLLVYDCGCRFQFDRNLDEPAVPYDGYTVTAAGSDS